VCCVWGGPGTNLVEGLVEIAGLFLDEVFKVVAHGVTVGGVDRPVPLFQPRQEFKQAGENRNQSRVFAAAEVFFDVDVVIALTFPGMFDCGQRKTESPPGISSCRKLPTLAKIVQR